MTTWLAPNPMTRAVGLALVEFVWQGALIGATAALLLFALRRATPQARYVIGCLALAGMAAAPVVTFVTHLSDRPTGRIPSFVDTAGEAVAAGRETASGRPSMLEAERAVHAPLVQDHQLPLVVLAWALGVCLFSVHLLRGWRRVRQLWAAAIVLPSGVWPARLATLAARLGTTTRVRLIESASAAAPFVVGWVRPAIVVPTSALTGLTPSDLEAILAHELMHIRRADYLVNVIQCVIEILLFYHPAVWWVSRQIRVEREHCCDDLAAAALGDPVSYASALASLEALRGRRPVLAVAATGGDLLVRVRRLVSAEPPTTPTFSGGLAMCTVLTVFMLLVGGQVGQSSSAGTTGAPSAVPAVSTSVAIGEPPRETPMTEVQPNRDMVSGSSPTTSESDLRSAPAPVPVTLASATEPSPVPAQATAAQLVILVEDGHGILPGASVRLMSTLGGDVTAVTSAAGRASFGNVPVGDYLLGVELPGFRAARVAVSVPPGSSWLQIRLAIGALSESVHVTAPPEAVPDRPSVVRGTSVSPGSAPRSNTSDQSVAQARRVLQEGTLLTAPRTDLIPGEPPPLIVPVRVGGDVTPPRKLTDVTPAYPSAAVAEGLQGMVILEGTVASDGTVQDLRALRGPDMLAAAAADAVSQWRYTPTTLNRVPVYVPVTITVNFALR